MRPPPASFVVLSASHCFIVEQPAGHICALLLRGMPAQHTMLDGWLFLSAERLLPGLHHLRARHQLLEGAYQRGQHHQQRDARQRQRALLRLPQLLIWHF